MSDTTSWEQVKEESLTAMTATERAEYDRSPSPRWRHARRIAYALGGTLSINTVA